MKMAGFSLLEMLIALAISAVVMLSAGRFLPLLLAENAGVLQRAQLRQELQQMMATLEKAVRRAVIVTVSVAVGRCKSERIACCCAGMRTATENGKG